VKKGPPPLEKGLILREIKVRVKNDPTLG